MLRCSLNAVKAFLCTLLSLRYRQINTKSQQAALCANRSVESHLVGKYLKEMFKKKSKFVGLVLLPWGRACFFFFFNIYLEFGWFIWHSGWGISLVGGKWIIHSVAWRVETAGEVAQRLRTSADMCLMYIPLCSSLPAKQPLALYWQQIYNANYICTNE